MTAPRHSLCAILLSCILPLASCEKGGIPEDIPQSYESKVVSSGLSNRNVTCFAEDAEGYIWIGTESGLNKFNGNEYVQYYHTEDSTSINTNRI